MRCVADASSCFLSKLSKCVNLTRHSTCAAIFCVLASAVVTFGNELGNEIASETHTMSGPFALHAKRNNCE